MTISLSILAQDWQINAFLIIFLCVCLGIFVLDLSVHTCLYSEQRRLQWKCADAFGGHCNITTQPLFITSASGPSILPQGVTGSRGKGGVLAWGCPPLPRQRGFFVFGRMLLPGEEPQRARREMLADVGLTSHLKVPPASPG